MIAVSPGLATCEMFVRCLDASGIKQLCFHELHVRTRYGFVPA
jgi:hypothetical protein